MNESLRKVTEDFARQIFDGNLHSKQIHQGLYNSTAQELISGLLGSFGTGFDYDSPANAALDYMQTNIFAFSAAKSLTEFEAFSKYLVRDGKRIATFKEFKDDISSLNIKFNERYLRAEYDSAIAHGQMAAKWHEFETNRDAGEFLEYRTAGDERVRASHKELDGKVFHIDDDILNRIYPPNDWNCRCTMVQVDTASYYHPEQEGDLEKKASIPKYFRNNSGKTGMIYTDGHPYFKNLKKVSQLKAVDNYNMWDLDRIYAKEELLSAAPNKFKSMDDFLSWHKQRIKTGPGNKDFAFECKALNNLWLTFDEDLFNRVSTSKKYVKEKRYQLIPFLEDTLNKPDEIWTVLQNTRFGAKTELETVLIKFYEDKPFVAVIKTERSGYIRITSFYEMDNMKDLGRWRRGILRYKKK